MNNSKVLETLNQFVISSYLQKLISVKLRKLVLHGVFPITGAANVSDPHIIAMIDDPEKILDFSRNLN